MKSLGRPVQTLPEDRPRARPFLVANPVQSAIQPALRSLPARPFHFHELFRLNGTEFYGNEVHSKRNTDAEDIQWGVCTNAQNLHPFNILDNLAYNERR